MLAQQLRHRIDIEALTVAIQDNDDEAGEQVEAWQSIRGSTEPELIPAAIAPLSGREFLAAAAIQAGCDTRITIRHRAGVIPSMRVVHAGTVYDIKAVLPDGSLRRHLTLMCWSGPNEG